MQTRKYWKLWLHVKAWVWDNWGFYVLVEFPSNVFFLRWSLQHDQVSTSESDLLVSGQVFTRLRSSLESAAASLCICKLPHMHILQHSSTAWLTVLRESKDGASDWDVAVTLKNARKTRQRETSQQRAKQETGSKGGKGASLLHSKPRQQPHPSWDECFLFIYFYTTLLYTYSFTVRLGPGFSRVPQKC